MPDTLPSLRELYDQSISFTRELDRIITDIEEEKGQDTISNIDQAGIGAIKAHEGFRNKAYKDSGGVWTIGYGHTGGVRKGNTISLQEGENFLRQDLKTAISGVVDNVKVPLTQNQFNALVSFVFNVGVGAFKKSTMLRHLNKGDYARAAAEFPRWKYVSGKVSKGLVNRRAAERKMFTKG